MVAVWQTEQAFKHAVCGTYDWEWEESATAWTAGIHWCLGCRDIELKKAEVLRDHPNGGIEGWTIRLYREPPEEVTDGD